VLAGGCSGSDTTFGPSCGAGTVLHDGQCVVASSDAGQADALVDRADGSESADVMASVSDAPSGSVSDAPASAADAAPSDPCPVASYSIAQNCDSTCSTLSTTSCSQARCGSGGQAASISFISSPLAVRTPDAPGTDPDCATECPGGGVAYAMTDLLVVSKDVDVRVAAPWAVYFQPANGPTPFPTCPLPAQTSSCVHVPASATEGALFIVTNDPQAPARNVYIEAGDACP
jgi:hypothetical protein